MSTEEKPKTRNAYNYEALQAKWSPRWKDAQVYRTPGRAGSCGVDPMAAI